MKQLLTVLVFIFILSSTCIAQEQKLLVDSRPVDFSAVPFYSRITQKVDGRIVFKEQYRSIEKLDINWITYSSGGLKITGLLIKPKAAGTYPCIIYNRGGNRDFGELTETTAFELARHAIQGYIVIASNYRGGGGSEGMEEFGGSDVNDVLNLLEVLKEVKGADPEKIGMYGWSRGGMMTYLALTRTEKIKAAVVGGAASDLTIIDRPEMEMNVYSQLMPDYWKNKEDELKKRSAVFWPEKFSKKVPILILHGNSDWRVKTENSLKMAVELDKHRVPYRLIIFDGADHGISEYRQEVDLEVYKWFDRFLKKNEKLPNMEYHGN